MTSPPGLKYGQYYHIYNRGNNREDIFVQERNYRHFLALYARHVQPAADTYAYCLLRNHFHLLVRVKTVEEQKAEADPLTAMAQAPGVSPTFTPKRPSQQFGNLFNAYAKAFNRAYRRTGSLFQHPFGRVMVTSDAHFQALVSYIHRNPQKHGFVDDFREWPYSSYHAIVAVQPTRIRRHEVLAWFGGQAGFQASHEGPVDERRVATLVPGDLY
ncbi:transposase [Chloroflexota bacterium]